MLVRTRASWIAAFAAAALIVATGVHAQIWRGGYGFFGVPKHPTATTFAGGFNHCRLMFMSDHREKRGWSTDYPGADINFSVRLGELTRGVPGVSRLESLRPRHAPNLTRREGRPAGGLQSGKGKQACAYPTASATSRWYGQGSPRAAR